MSDLSTALKVRRAIDRQLDELIRAGARCVRHLKGSDMKQNQIRNLVNVAAGTDSMEAVTNFIRYQIGRDSQGRQKWKEFGEAVIRDIEQGVVRKAVDAVMQEVAGADRTRVRAELTALYLGYLNRTFVFAEKTDNWETLGNRLGTERSAA